MGAVVLHRQGHEVSTWAERAKRQKKRTWFLKFFLTACLSVYLPLSRTVFQILMCEETLRGFMRDTIGLPDCKSWDKYLFLQVGEGGKELELELELRLIWLLCLGCGQIGAGAILLVFTLGVPVQCFLLIRKNKPIGSREDPTKRYNDHGELTEYTTAMYNEDLNVSVLVEGAGWGVHAHSCLACVLWNRTTLARRTAPTCSCVSWCATPTASCGSDSLSLSLCMWHPPF